MSSRLPTRRLPTTHYQLQTSNGFSLVEVMLAGALFSIITVSLYGALTAGQDSTRTSGERVRASYIAEEGLEAVRNMRDNAFTNLTDGTYGLVQSGNQWTLSGTSDTTGTFTRAVTIGTVDADTKSVISTVAWQQNLQRTGSITLETRITNWLVPKPIVLGSWTNPAMESELDISGNQDGLKVATSGNYAYIVMAGGASDFYVIDITNPASPSVVGLATISGNATNIAVSGNYAYVTSTQNNAELQIFDISNPSSPSSAGSYNAPGNEDANGVYVIGSTVYMVRVSSSSDEFLIVNASSPNSPTLTGSMDLADTAYEVVVIGNFAYLASAGNSNEMVVVNVTVPVLPVQAGVLNLSGDTDAVTITGFNSTIMLGRNNGELNIANVTVPASPLLTSTLAVQSSGSVNDIDVGRSNTYAFIASTDSGSPEFQVVDITNLASPSVVGSVDTLNAQNGVAYNATLDRAVLVGAGDASEFKIMKPQ